MVEGSLTAVEDYYPILRRHKKKFVACVCVFIMLISLPMLTQSGHYWLTLIDSYGPSGIALLFVVFFEVIGLSWGFGRFLAHSSLTPDCAGTERVALAMEDMMGSRPSRVWIFLWKYGSPAVCVVS
jgi:SNF family Na+-dependent transporter